MNAEYSPLFSNHSSLSTFFYTCLSHLIIYVFTSLPSILVYRNFCLVFRIFYLTTKLYTETIAGQPHLNVFLLERFNNNVLIKMDELSLKWQILHIYNRFYCKCLKKPNLRQFEIYTFCVLQMFREMYTVI